jgi:murein DD-endopeptidase MepM/ murein hydrolase activator NlpD
MFPARFPFLLVLSLLVATAAARAQEAANLLFVDAMTDARTAGDPLHLRRLLDAVAEGFPDTAQARAIAADRVPGLDRSALPADPAWHQLVVPGGTIGGFTHGQFPSLGDRTHPGIDIGGGCGLPIVAPRGGTVVRVVSGDVTDSELAEMGITRDRNTRDLEENTGNAVVLRHPGATPPVHTIYLHMAETPADEAGRRWAPGDAVPAGARLGLVGETGKAYGCHVHFEARRFEGTHKYLHPTFGNIYPTGDVSGSDSFAQDWIIPTTWLREAFVATHLEQRDAASKPPAEQTAPLAKDSEETSGWGPGLVAGVEMGYNPCGANKDDDACLRGLGLSDEAIDFSHAMDGDYSGFTIGASFQELGPVDFAVAQFVGNTTYYLPVLLNGPLGLHRLAMTRDLAATFRDDASRKMLARYPRATNVGGVSVRAHRLLADGTQRFVIQETVHDGCRACPILGSAFSFADIGPATGGVLARRPIGLALGDPDEKPDLTAALVRAQPDALQVALNALGYDAGQMDGFPGPQTRGALMDFQVEHCRVPTGQPDPATAETLVRASGFDTPCAGARLPDGIDANSPLRTGIYVDDPGKCALESLPFDTVHLSQRIVRPAPAGITFGQEGGCSTARTDIRAGITLYRGTCNEGNQTREARWRLDVLSNDSFIDLDMTDGAPRQFTRCADDSLLRQSWAAWLPESAAPAQLAVAQPAEVVPTAVPTAPAQMQAGWQASPGVAQLLAEIRNTHPAQAFEGCEQAHGPIGPEQRQALLAGTVLILEDRNGAASTRIVTNDLLAGDRFCLDGNRARCAANNYQLYHCAAGAAPLVNVRSSQVAYRVTDVQPQVRNPSISGRIESAVFGAAAPDLPVEGRNCTLTNGWAEPTAARWAGRCENGRATGPGVLEWLKGPEVIWRTRIGPLWDMALEDGRLRFDIDLDAFRFEMDSCDQGLSGYRGVGVIVPADKPVTYFENSWIVEELLGRAVALAQADCPVPNKGVSNIAVSIRWANGESAVRARNYETDRLTWREFKNTAVQTMQRDLVQAERSRQQREREQAARARAEVLAAQFKTRRDALEAAAREFLATGNGGMDELAVALEIDEIGTLGRLEDGVTLRLGAAEGIETTTHDGSRHYRVAYDVASPMARLEQEFRSKQDFSWENWMAMTQAASPRRTRIACLFAKVAQLPKEAREVEGRLLTFASDTRAVTISLLCE